MYRITYVSGGRPLGLTLRCSQSEALEFAEWLESEGLRVLTVKGLQ